MPSSLLLEFEGANGSTTTTDSSASGHAVTFLGSAVISTAQQKYGVSSLLISDGTSGHITIPAHADFALGTGDFTIQAQVYVVSWANVSIQGVLNIGDYSSGCYWRVRSTGHELLIRGTQLHFSSAISTGAWHHIEISRVGGTIYGFLDGTLITSHANSGDIPGSLGVTIGRAAHVSYESFQGYIDEVAIYKGVGKHTSNFTPTYIDERAICVVTHSVVPGAADSTAISKTGLLVHGNGADGSQLLFDSSPHHHTVTAIGTARISSAQSKFADSSIYFDGDVANYLSLPVADEIQLLQKFTVEAWVYPQSASGKILGNITATQNTVTRWYVNNSNTGDFPGFAFCIENPGYDLLAFYTGVALSNDIWQHIAVSRDGSNVIRLFVDGVLQTTSTFHSASPLSSGSSLVNTTHPLHIGKGFEGYLSDFRIICGHALYTENFVTPGYLPGVVDPNERQYVGYINTFHPGTAEAQATAWTGYKYGPTHTTWSLSCNDPVTSNWTVEDTGSPLFGSEGAIYLTYGVVNSANSPAFGETSLFFPAYARILLPDGAGTILANTEFTLEFWMKLPTGGGFPFALPGFPAIACNFVADRWTHFAICRKSNILRYYLDGQKFYEAVSVGALTIAGFGTSTSSNPFYLDSIGFSNHYAHYSSNNFPRSTRPFYVVGSSAGARMQMQYSLIPCEVHGSTITPVEADSQWAKTVFLLRGGGDDGSTLVTEAKGRAITSVDVVHSATQRKHLQSSLYFNGTSSLIEINPSRSLDLHDGRDFTIEFWLYPTRIQLSSILDKWGDVRRSYSITLRADESIAFDFQDFATSTVTTVVSPAAVLANTWSFVSVCKFGTDYRVCVNGVGGEVITTAKLPRQDSTRMYSIYGGYRSWDGEIVIGANNPRTAAPAQFYQGYIEDFRITNGFARYSNLSSYQPPTTAFLPTGSVVGGDPYWPDVVALFHFNEPNGTVTGFRDAKGHTLNTVGNVYIDNTMGLYGNGLLIDANGKASIPYGTEFDFSAGDFTVEFFSRFLDYVYPVTLFSNSYNQGNRGFSFGVNPLVNPDSSVTRGYFQWTQWNASGVQDVAISNLYVWVGERHNRYHHIAVTRKGDDITIYVDGVGNTTSIVRRPAALTAPVAIGPPAGHANGTGIDELRITRAARYVQDFIVPTAAFPEQAFSIGDAVVSFVHTFIAGQVAAAASVGGADVIEMYSVLPPLIIGQPSVYGATCTVTMPVLAGDATGGEGIPQALAVVDSLSALLAFEANPSLRLADTVSAQTVRYLDSRLGVTDTVSAVLASAVVAESVQFAPALAPITQALKQIAEAFDVNAGTSGVCAVLVLTAINVTGSADRAQGADVLDEFTVSTPVAATTQSLAYADGMSVSAESGYAGHSVASSGLGFAQAVAAGGAYVGAVSELIALAGAPTFSLILYVTADEDVDLSGVPTQTLLYSAVVQDHIHLKTFFASPVYTTWAMNTRNAAVTQYSGFNFNSFARMGERYLGANDQGLYWLDGDDDAGRELKSRITTGIIQPNGNKLAGVQYAYLGMRGDGQFVVTVTDEAGGSYNYTLTGSSLETARVVFGRGFKTRYFTFSLESQGQDFDLDSVEFVTTELTRKVQR